MLVVILQTAHGEEGKKTKCTSLRNDLSKKDCKQKWATQVECLRPMTNLFGSYSEVRKEQTATKAMRAAQVFPRCKEPRKG